MHFPHEGERLAQVSAFSGDAYTVELPLKAIPMKEALLEELDQWLAREQGAATDGDAAAARDYGARAERARRWLARLDELPERKSYPLRFTVYRMGDAVWVACGGEPYSAIQVALRRRFPGNAIMCSPLAGNT